MSILLDECLPRKLKALLGECECSTAPEMGWAGKRNGELVRLTSDRNLSFQQNSPGFSIAVIVLHAGTNRLESLAPLMPAVLEVLSSSLWGRISLRLPKCHRSEYSADTPGGRWADPSLEYR